MKIVVLFLSLYISYSASAQKFEILWGKEAEYKSYITNFSSVDDSAVLKYSWFAKMVFFKYTNVKGFLSKYTDPLKEPMEVEFPAEIDDVSNSHIVELKGNHFIIYKNQDKRKDSAIF